MFALRGVAVSLASFVLLYAMLSLLVALAWRSVRFLPATTERRMANLLFAARVFPLLASALITVLLVIPSFDIFEPRSINEHLGDRPLLLGVCALLLIACGVWRVIAAQRHASRLVAGWLEGAVPLLSGEISDAFTALASAPPLTLVGVHRPKILVSKATVAALTEGELRIALRHEAAHKRSHDNLKKLVFRLCPCPGMQKLEAAWAQAAELTADTAAVASAHDAVELAAALVKVSRLMAVRETSACAVGFMTGSVETRVARLLAWEEPGMDTSHTPLWYGVVPIAMVLRGLVVIYGPALVLTHKITEWLIR